VLAEEIIEKLFLSFTELEQAINSAKSTLNNKPNVPSFVFERLSSYDAILSKQRELASNLCFYVEQNNIAEIGRHVGLINQLSQMVRDDAKDILGVLTTENEENPDGEEERKYTKSAFCC
jgi:hypothetical protein